VRRGRPFPRSKHADFAIVCWLTALMLLADAFDSTGALIVAGLLDIAFTLDFAIDLLRSRGDPW
jgi:hypothetical protein